MLELYKKPDGSKDSLNSVCPWPIKRSRLRISSRKTKV